MGQRIHETSSSWAHSQQEQYLTHLYLPHLPWYLTPNELILTLYPVWHLNKDASKEGSVVHIGEEGYKLRGPEGGRCLVAFEEQQLSGSWRQELPLERKPGFKSFSATAAHFKKIKFQEHLINRLWCFYKRKKSMIKLDRYNNDVLVDCYMPGNGVGHLSALSHLVLTLLLQR